MSQPVGAALVGAERLSRCLACGAKLKLAEGSGGKVPVASCPMCGLSLASIPDCPGFPPFVAPKVSRDEAWKALARERGFAPDGNEARLIEARLLLVPYWIGSQGGSVAARSAADLRPIGLPPVSEEAGVPRGLDLLARTRSGDFMGRHAEGVIALEATAVQVILAPQGGNASSTLESVAKDPASAGWRLVCYPVWAFHYSLYEKEHHHVVDAASGCPVGPAHTVRWVRAAVIASAALLGSHMIAGLILGPFAALPAWAAALAGLRLSIGRDRR